MTLIQTFHSLKALKPLPFMCHIRRKQPHLWQFLAKSKALQGLL